MRLLLDTHIVLWMVTERSHLSAAELGAIYDPDNDLMISAVSIWEVRIKWDSLYRSGDRKGRTDPQGLLDTIETMDLTVEPMTARLAAASLNTPIASSDPFDKLLLTIAQETGRKLLTRDTRLRGHPLAYCPK